MVSMLKAFYGENATKDNEFGYHNLPKQYKKKMDHMRFIELMDQGKINGYICQGYNPLASYPDKNKISSALRKLKFLIVCDPLATDITM